MSLYNLLFGANPYCALYLAMLGLEEREIPRFRDCSARLIDGKPHIVLLTRTGGPYRESDLTIPVEEAYSTFHHLLTLLPGYVGTKDQDVDWTYAEFYFSVPDEHLDAVNQLLQIGGTDQGEDKWQNLFTSLNDGSYLKNPELVKNLERTTNLIKAALKGSE